MLRQVLARRGIESPQELDLSLKHLVPVGRFSALDGAVNLLLEYRSKRIVVVGDFDADGATSTALVVLTLRNLGFAQVEYFIPDRFELGYGLSREVVARLAALEPELLITVDNGISSIDGVAAAHEAGMAVLITDHHLPGERLPDAEAIVNPNMPGDGFPGKQLAGVGVAFYLLAALGKAMARPAAVSEYLDLVALGTVADLVRLDRSNRILVEQGLRRIRAGQCRPGLLALCRVAGVDPQAVRAETLGYQIAPRLNAAGRLDDMSIGVRCLLGTDPSELERLAAELDSLNRERRELEGRMRGEAMRLMADIEPFAEAAVPDVICLHRPDWHQGLVGLVASRVKQRYHRPAFAFAPGEGGVLKGSGRSIAGFHLRDALAEVDTLYPGLVLRFGGHAMAAGLTLAAEALDDFRAAIAAVGRDKLTAEHLAECIYTDGELAPAQLDLEAALALRDAGPWGQGFPAPCFDGRFQILEQRLLKDAHLKMSLQAEPTGRPVDAIAFNCESGPWHDGQRVRVVYRLAVNDYYEALATQLIVEHIEAEP